MNFIKLSSSRHSTCSLELIHVILMTLSSLESQFLMRIRQSETSTVPELRCLEWDHCHQHTSTSTMHCMETMVTWSHCWPLSCSWNMEQPAGLCCIAFIIMHNSLEHPWNLWNILRRLLFLPTPTNNVWTQQQAYLCLKKNRSPLMMKNLATL